MCQHTPACLWSLEDGSALFEIGGDALFGILALEEELLQLAFDGEPFGEAGFEARLHGALHPADGAARL
jgi:hypothetical protein